MQVLGLSAYTRRSGAALVGGGRAPLVHGEEEFSRELGDAGFPARAARRCLARAGIQARELDEAVFFEKRLRRFERVLTCELAAFPRSLSSFPRVLGRWLGEGLWTRARLVSELGLEPGQVRFAAHHASHAASAFLSSPFEQAAVLVVDDAGEWVTTSIWRGRGAALEPLEELRFPHSLGEAAARLARVLGLEPTELDDLAAHGSPDGAARVAELLGAAADGALELDALLAPSGSECPEDLEALAQRLGCTRAPGAPLEYSGARRAHADLAASILAALGDAFAALARRALRASGCGDLCVAGELARLPALVERAARDGGAREVWVPAAPDDAGAALGAALWTRHVVHGEPRDPRRDAAGELEPLAQDDRADDAPAADPDTCAQRLAAGATLARMRCAGGDAALGARAIVASPASAGAARALVETVRRDPPWRRPLLLLREQDAAAALELHPALRRGAGARPTRARPSAGWSEALAQACAPDGHLRVRLVSRASEGELGELLDACAARGLPPALLAVPFAQRGELPPRHPREARERFARAGVDALDLGGRLYER
jgi:carbamoyltransferase